MEELPFPVTPLPFSGSCRTLRLLPNIFDHMKEQSCDRSVKALAMGTLLMMSFSGTAQDTRVIGGQDAAEGQFPWMVEMLFFADEHLCGATLIHPLWVLTAGHCAAVAEEDNMRLIAHSITNTSGTPGPQAEELQVDTIIYHPGWDGENGPDLAMIRLAQPATTVPVQLLDPALASLLQTGDSAWVLGWGTADTTTLLMASTLQYAPAGLVDYATCAAIYTNGTYDFFGLNGTEGLICAGQFSGSPLTGTGNGDSGGPLLVMNQGEWAQVGVVYGGEGSHVTSEFPGVFTTVAYNWDWIQGLIAGSTGITGPTHATTPDVQVTWANDHAWVTLVGGPQRSFTVDAFGADGRLIASSVRYGRESVGLHLPSPPHMVLLRVADERGFPIANMRLAAGL